ncbi:hypothetical protein MKX03_009563, partial [Papaver bracteatum]
MVYKILIAFLILFVFIRFCELRVSYSLILWHSPDDLKGEHVELLMEYDVFVYTYMHLEFIPCRIFQWACSIW